IATKAETNDLIAASAQANYIVYPEDRLHPIKMTKDIPQRWTENGLRKMFSDSTTKGENFTFQLGIIALKQLEDVKIRFTDLAGNNGNIISSDRMFCFNTTG